jgi:surfactin synthase thioesterase subunit
MTLIILPFAGGSQFSFNEMVYAANAKGIKPVPVEYPGRGKRFTDPLLENIHDIVEDVFLQVKNHLAPPYAIYAHSMGCIVGYLLIHKIMNKGIPLPVHLFFSGCCGPSVVHEMETKHTLQTDEFIEKLRELGGCPEAILEDEQLLNIFLPVIRSDFRAVETYIYKRSSEPLKIPISVIIGTEDKVTYEDAKLWQQETNKAIEIFEFKGNHFFIFGNEQKIVDLIYADYKPAGFQ